MKIVFGCNEDQLPQSTVCEEDELNLNDKGEEMNKLLLLKRQY